MYQRKLHYIYLDAHCQAFLKAAIVKFFANRSKSNRGNDTTSVSEAYYLGACACVYTCVREIFSIDKNGILSVILQKKIPFVYCLKIF